MIKILIILSFVLFQSCSTPKDLIPYDNLSTQLENPEINLNPETYTKAKSLPKVWRGRKLFISPWAYIYAYNQDYANQAYKEIQKVVDEHNDGLKPDSPQGIIFITGENDQEVALNYNELTLIYTTLLKRENIQSSEREILKKELDIIHKIEKFKVDSNGKIAEALEDQDLTSVKKGMDTLFSKASLYMQPEVTEKLLETKLSEDIYWAAFISSEDAIKEDLDNLISFAMDDKMVPAVSRALIWTFVAPGHFFRKEKVVKETRDFFAKGFQENAVLKKGSITLIEGSDSD
ncbi:MAG: hypothetical protein NE330_19820 [Lentisphaeraceae bacterium]|nr:hypothetical protein [Lentisphaeraceae bacterium]